MKLLAQDNYISYNRDLARRIGPEATIVFGELCSVSNLFGTEDFYCLKEQIIDRTALSERAVRLSIKKLNELGVLGIIKKGIPCKNYYTINIEKLLELLDDNEPKTPTDDNDESRDDVFSDVESNTSSDINNDITSGVKNAITGDIKSAITFKNKRENIKENINKNIISYSQSSPTEDKALYSPPSLSMPLTSSSSANAEEEPEKPKLKFPDDIKNEPEKKTYTKNDYSNIFSLHNKIKKDLFQKGLCKQETEIYNYPLLNKMLKKKFDTFGIPMVIKAIENSANDEWVCSTGFSLQTILSDKVFSREINGNYFGLNSTVNRRPQQQKTAYTADNKFEYAGGF